MLAEPRHHSGRESAITGPKAEDCSAHRAGEEKSLVFCKSEGLKCQCGCQEKQGFQVEITRGSSWSKSGCNKTLPFAMATCFPLTSLLPGTNPLLQDSAAWPNATAIPRWHCAPLKTWLSCQDPPTRLEAHAEMLAPHTCAHTATPMRVFLPCPLGCVFFIFWCAWLKTPADISVMGREISKVEKWLIL